MVTSLLEILNVFSAVSRVKAKGPYSGPHVPHDTWPLPACITSVSSLTLIPPAPLASLQLLTPPRHTAALWPLHEFFALPHVHRAPLPPGDTDLRRLWPVLIQCHGDYPWFGAEEQILLCDPVGLLVCSLMRMERPLGPHRGVNGAFHISVKEHTLVWGSVPGWPWWACWLATVKVCNSPVTVVAGILI